MSNLILPRRFRDGGSVATPRRNQRGFIINPYQFGGPPPPTDPLFAFVTSLLHMDGVNGGTSFPDIIGSNTWAGVSGGPITSTTEKKFGTASYYSTGSVLGSATALGAGPGSGDFCIEGWFRAEVSGGSFDGLFDSLFNASINGLACGYDRGGGNWQVYIGGGAYSSAAMAIPTLVWTHFAFDRLGTAAELTIGGALAIAVTSGASHSETSMNFGAYYNNSTTFDGFIDETRITVGASRYRAPFTPPTSPFPDS